MGAQRWRSLDATGLAAALGSGALRSLELVEMQLTAIARENAALGAYTFVDERGALEAAARSDARRAAGLALGPLDGIPLAVKANIAVRGWPWTAGLGFRREHLATDDAFVVSRLRAAGAVLLGTTNMDEGALGASTVNPWYGATRNPHRPSHSAGGSSGGSAAAVAAGLAAAALGSDTIGSVRIPAAWCGIAALKPTFGAVSPRGLYPLAHRFDHIGPMARSVRDLELLLETLVAHDAACEVSFPIPLRPARDVGSLEVLFASGLEAVGLTAEVETAWQHALAALRSVGCRLRPFDVSALELSRARRAVFALCEVEMARAQRAHRARHPQDFSPALGALLDFGERQSGADLQRHESRLAALQAAVLGALGAADVLALPTTPQCAHALEAAAPQSSADLTVIASATGLPALSVPLPRAAHELPVGLQLVGKAGGERQLLALARALEDTWGAAAGG